MNLRRQPGALLSRIQGRALLVGVGAGIVSVVGAIFWINPFFEGYLIGFLLCLEIALGCLAVSMLHHLTGGQWGLAIRPVLEAGSRTIPWLAVLFLPLLLLAPPYLYVWARPEAVASNPLLQFKSAYLNVPAFQLRALLYFGIWIALAVLLNRWSRAEIATRDPKWENRQQTLSGPGLVLYGLTITFASVDWVMSLEPYWFSSAFGVLFMAAQALAGLSFAILLTLGLRGYWPWSELATVERRHDLGNLLLAFVMFWSYVAFMQFLIIWSGNLPEETPWYLHRAFGPWGVVALFVAGLHFAVPFLLLLARQTKRDSTRLAFVAILLLLMRLVDLMWLVLPTFTPYVLRLHWLHVMTPLALGGIWLALFARALSEQVDWLDSHPDKELAHD